MLRERAAGCGDTRQLPGPPRVACESSREGVKIIHARRHPCWNVTLSYAVAWRAPCAPERPPKPLSPCDASITRPAPATISATGSRGIRLRRLHSAASWPLSWWAVTSMPPDNVKGRPPVPSQESGPDADSATITAASIARDAGTRPASARRRERRPIANASLYYPVPGRGLYWLSIRCPYCGGTHLGRVREEIKAGGNRRVSCGPVQVVVRRVYRPAAGKAAA